MSSRSLSLWQLETPGNFIGRHIGSNSEQIQAMLTELGIDSLDDIISKAIPENIIETEELKLTQTISERAVIKHLRKIRERNIVYTSLIGMGYHDTIMPAVIKRNVLENPGWYTAYTPYQAEVSQGRLEALITFQHMICDLTGMEIANASLLDESTAAAEAVAMSRRVSRSKSNTVLIDKYCHPQTIAVVTTRAESMGFELKLVDINDDLASEEFFALVVQYPNTMGEISSLSRLSELSQQKQALLTVAADILSLLLIKAPADFDADIVVGNSQRFGVPMGYGGPHAAFFATREKYKRSMPGRLIGVSKDVHGQLAYRMALQTREQHIRRDKATSNICTSQVLLAVIASFYAIYHGPKGLRIIAERVHRYSQIMALGFSKLGFEVTTKHYFDTFVVAVPQRAKRIVSQAEEAGINLRLIDDDHLGIALDETTNRRVIRKVWRIFVGFSVDLPDIQELDKQVIECIPKSLLREDEVLQHPVFENYHSETKMMRYMRGLARKDIALDRSMIPLGSCTMKLNSATEMQAISSHEFNGLHPFSPIYQALGYQQLFDELDDMLCDVTGFDAFSFQPNAGSQGEYAGLLVIKKYHQQRGEGHRNICLIPASAHGTNPASAVMAGFKVVVLQCDENGNVSVDDLQAKLEKHKDNIAALMITYPSTHGVYEEAFTHLCKLVHDAGGQVYLDGANFNALIGISRPGKIGADVAHLNLHKTFCIPHGGGGPGAGPIGVAKHLAPYLPSHPVVAGVNPYQKEGGTIGTISAAPWGSATILLISWAYIAMMGAYGLRKATLNAILNANYIAKRLQPYYQILYTGKNGWVAHECIIDCRAYKDSCDITVDDIAKRLIDFGFHAPTISFPVAGTLMIEPTESEDKEEIDRFCDALIKIHQEIEQIETGQADKQNNVIKNAPHTHQLLLEDWSYPYSKSQAFFPNNQVNDDKYWPPVGRIDNVFGDKNIFCSCPDISQYNETD